ncbi:hypothetical protein C8Q80DRAFT_1258371 [Daedaleopsis nitida]|nr:hypothetical protein C8Q80DRAFT_1258371 [Daedaleopsis nitida]
MATRQNKKRKGRSNAPPRERTVTTLTDGADGPFSSSPDDEHSSVSLLSTPFSVTSPISASAQPPGIPGSFPLQPFSNPFPYPFATMSSMGPPYPHQQHPFAPVAPDDSPPSPSFSVANDLRVLEKLKETIKNNQHGLYRPIPQPAALASLYLGPGSSHVPPHPEQVPRTPSALGSTLKAHDPPKSAASDSSPNGLIQPASTRNASTSDVGDGARKPVHRLSVSESPKIDALRHPVANLPVKVVDRYEPGSNSHPGSTRQEIDTGSSPRFANAETSPRTGPPGSQRSEQGSRPGEITPNHVPLPAKLQPTDPKDGPRTSSSLARYGSYDERDHGHTPGSRQDPRNGNDVRGPPPPVRDQRLSDRDQDRIRERERSRDREYDRDKDRDRRPDYNRFRDDRRTDDRSRPPEDRRPLPVNDRRYEPRYTPRGDRNPTDQRPPHRNLGEERAIVRPPATTSPAAQPVAEDRRPPAPSDDRSARPPLAVDDRRPPAPPLVIDETRPLAPPPSSARLIDDRRPPTDDRRPPPPSLNAATTRPDDRRPPPLERPSVGSDDRRRPVSPIASERPPRPVDDRRTLAPPPRAPSVDRQVRPSDDRRPPVSPPTGRPPVEDRRPTQPPVPPDRTVRPPDERRPPLLEERISRAPAPPEPARAPAEHLASRPVQPDDRSTRPVPLEERISRAPSLQERLSYPPARADDKTAPRLEERLSRPGANPASLEARLSNPPTVDNRALRPLPDDRPAIRPPPPSDRPTGRAVDDRTVLAEPARALPPTERPSPPSDDRRFAPGPVGRFARPVSPAASDRGRPYRAPSVARDEPRSYRPHSPARPPSRADSVRDFRPGGDPRDRPAPYRASEPERYPAERRPEPMDVDPPRFPERASYRRPSPPPGDSYPPRADRDRAWVPAGEAPPFRDEPGRRPPADSQTYPREWREGDRPPHSADYDRSWDRPPEFDRGPRLPADRDAPPNWDTRPDRERRAAYPPDLPPSTAPRSFEQRPLSSRLTDSYAEDRAYARDSDRDRYPPPPADSAPYSRVRPRSPSPMRRSTAADELRPPLKRARDDAYSGGGGAYYPDEPRGPPPPPSDYPPPRMRSPPPAGEGTTTTHGTAVLRVRATGTTWTLGSGMSGMGTTEGTRLGGWARRVRRRHTGARRSAETSGDTVSLRGGDMICSAA